MNIENTIHTAVRNGEFARVRQMILYGVDVNEKDQKGNTPLIYAIIENRSRIAKLLLDAGAEVNIETDNGSSLYVALICRGADRKNKIYKTIAAANPNPPGKSPLGETTILGFAVKTRSSVSLINELISLGADVAAADSKGKPLFMLPQRIYGDLALQNC